MAVKRVVLLLLLACSFHSGRFAVTADQTTTVAAGCSTDADCATGEFCSLDSGVCEVCADGCLTCTAAGDVCTACADGFRLDDTTCTAITEESEATTVAAATGGSSIDSIGLNSGNGDEGATPPPTRPTAIPLPFVPVDMPTVEVAADAYPHWRLTATTLSPMGWETYFRSIAFFNEKKENINDIITLAPDADMGADPLRGDENNLSRWPESRLPVPGDSFQLNCEPACNINRVFLEQVWPNQDNRIPGWAVQYSADGTTWATKWAFNTKFAEQYTACAPGYTLAEDNSCVVSLVSATAGAINIISAVYGRSVPGSEVCPLQDLDSFTECQQDVSDWAMGNYNGYMDGVVRGDGTFSHIFGDPCEGTYKYLQIVYNCGADDSAVRTFITCDYDTTPHTFGCSAGSENNGASFFVAHPSYEPADAPTTEGHTTKKSVSCARSLIEEEVVTLNEYYYHFLPSEVPEDVTSIVFQVKASNDAHTVLSDNSSDEGQIYEVVLSGWGNTQSVIRKAKQGTNLAAAPSVGVLDGNESRLFWISWANGRIALGKGGVVGQDEIVAYEDPEATPVKHIGFSTGWGANGVWAAPECPCPKSIITGEINTADEYRYQILPSEIPASLTSFVFQVRANNDAHTVLSADYGDEGQIYEIVLSGWGNTQSVIRKAKQGENLATSASVGVLDANESRLFWISWANGRIALGKGGVVGEDEIVAYQDPEPTPVKYIGFSTGWGSSGVWAAPDCPGANKKAAIMSGTINVVSAFYGRTVPGSEMCPIPDGTGRDFRTDCEKQDVSQWVRGNFNGLVDGVIQGDGSFSHIFGDPCYWTYKYISISYTCGADDTNVRTFVVCDYDLAPHVFGCSAKAENFGQTDFVATPVYDPSYSAGTEGNVAVDATTVADDADSADAYAIKYAPKMTILKAWYGRQQPGSDVCPIPDGTGRDTFTDCATDAFYWAWSNFNGQSEGTIEGDISLNGVFGDPCGNTYKYLYINYMCGGEQRTFIRCEWDLSPHTFGCSKNAENYGVEYHIAQPTYNGNEVLATEAAVEYQELVGKYASNIPVSAVALLPSLVSKSVTGNATATEDTLSDAVSDVADSSDPFGAADSIAKASEVIVLSLDTLPTYDSAQTASLVLSQTMVFKQVASLSLASGKSSLSLAPVIKPESLSDFSLAFTLCLGALGVQGGSDDAPATLIDAGSSQKVGEYFRRLRLSVAAGGATRLVIESANPDQSEVSTDAYISGFSAFDDSNMMKAKANKCWLYVISIGKLSDVSTVCLMMQDTGKWDGQKQTPYLAPKGSLKACVAAPGDASWLFGYKNENGEDGVSWLKLGGEAATDTGKRRLAAATVKVNGQLSDARVYDAVVDPNLADKALFKTDSSQAAGNQQAQSATQNNGKDAGGGDLSSFLGSLTGSSLRSSIMSGVVVFVCAFIGTL